VRVHGTLIPPFRRFLRASRPDLRLHRLQLLARGVLVSLAPAQRVASVLNEDDVVIGVRAAEPAPAAPAPAPQAAPAAPPPLPAPVPAPVVQGEVTWLLGASSQDASSSVALRVETLCAPPMRVRVPLDATFSALTDALLPLLLRASGDADGAQEHCMAYVRVGDVTHALELPSAASSVATLAAALRAAAPPPAGLVYRLQYSGRTLRVGATLASFGVTSGSTVFATLEPAAALDRRSALTADAVPAAAFDYACCDLDLHTAEHGLFATPATAAASLRAWGFAADGAEMTLYGVLRQAPARHSGSERTEKISSFDALPAWQPHWRPSQDQSAKGTAAALSALRCLADAHKANTSAAESIEAAFRAAVPFPPAAAALHTVLRGAKLRDAEKAALAFGLHRLLRDRVSRDVESDPARLFEHAPAVLATLLAGAAAVHARDFGSWATAQLHDSTLTHMRLEEPVRVRHANGALSQNVHSRARLLRMLRGGDLHLPQGPFDADIALEQIEPDVRCAALLLAHPVPDLEAQVFTATLDPAPAAAAVAAAYAAAAGLGAQPRNAWRSAIAAALLAPAAKAMREMPPLALKRCAAPALARGADGLHRVFMGPLDCSAKLSLYNPLRRCLEEVDADELAAALGGPRHGDAAAEADNRPPEEILVVCLDVSRSMNSMYAADEDSDSERNGGGESDQSDDEVEPDTEAMVRALDTLRQSSQAALLGALAAGSSRQRDGVIQLLSTENPVLKATLAQGRRRDLGARVLAVLETAAAQTGVPGAAAPRTSALSGAVPTHCVKVVLPASLAPPAELLLPAAPSYTVATLAALLEERTGAPADRMVLSKRAGTSRRRRGDATLLDMAATLADADLGAGAELELTFTDGPIISRAPGAAPPEPIYLRIKQLHRHTGEAVDLKADASWTPRRLMLEIFRAHSSWAPADHSILLGLTEAGDGQSTYQQALSVWPDFCRGANFSHLRTYFTEELSSGKGLDPRAPIEVTICGQSAPSTRRRRRRANERHLTRNAAVHQLFAAFANRAAAFDLPLHVGLISFGTKVNTMSRVTPLFERFIAAVNRTSPDGDTALWDALIAGVDMAAQAFPGLQPLRRRVLVLTDGEDSCSTSSASAVVNRARELGVVIDAITLGDAASATGGSLLRAVTTATDGLCFAPATLRDALKQVELETVLSSGERPAPAAAPAWLPSRTPPATDSALLASYGGRGTVYTRADVVPPRRTDPALSRPALAASRALDAFDSAAGAAPAPAPAGAAGTEISARSAEGMRKLAQELRAVTSEEVMGAEFLATYDVYPAADDLSFWRIVMSGRSETPYAAGTFLLSVRFPPSYPALPPAVRFETTVLHPNVNAYGRICSALLGSEWSAGAGGRPLMPYVLRMIYSLFSSPETANPLNSALALDFYTAGGVYEVQVAEHVEAHATQKDRAQWRRELLGDDA
jgi:ubiquitin-protein ligase